MRTLSKPVWSTPILLVCCLASCLRLSCYFSFLLLNNPNCFVIVVPHRLYMACLLLCCQLCGVSLCVSLSSQRIQSVNTNVERSLEGFKAHAVFQEINKKLEEVSSFITVCYLFQVSCIAVYATNPHPVFTSKCLDLFFDPFHRKCAYCDL